MHFGNHSFERILGQGSQFKASADATQSWKNIARTGLPVSLGQSEFYLLRYREMCRDSQKDTMRLCVLRLTKFCMGNITLGPYPQIASSFSTYSLPF